MTTKHRRLHPLHLGSEVSPHPPLAGPAPLVFAKRLVRRGLRWYLWPVTGRVSEHNHAVADVVEEHRRNLAWLRMEAERLACEVVLARGSE